MGMTPAQYFEAFVDPNRWDCHESPGDIRRAFNAAVSASHLADHYFAYGKRHHPRKVESFDNIGKFVEYLCNETNGAFRDIRSVSNAYKHLYTSEGPTAKYESINSCGSIESLELSNSEDLLGMEEEYLKPRTEEARLSVIIKRKDGTQAEFLPLLDLVVNYFGDLINADA